MRTVLGTLACVLLALGEQEGQEPQISRLPALVGGRVPGVEEGVGFGVLPQALLWSLGRKVLSPTAAQ